MLTTDATCLAAAAGRALGGGDDAYCSTLTSQLSSLMKSLAHGAAHFEIIPFQAYY